MQAEPTWTDVAGLAIVGAQLVVLIAAALVAWRQVAEAKRLREEQARPFVVIDFDVLDHLIFIVVSNVGNTLATDVRFEVEPAFNSTIEDYQARDLKMFREGIPTLAPGKAIRTLFDSFPAREEKGLPDANQVTVRYRDEQRRRGFAEVMDLDIGLYRNVLSVTRHDVHHVNKTLEKMLKEMKHWRWQGRRGLITLSPKEQRVESKRELRHMKRRRRRREGRDMRSRVATLLPPWARHPGSTR